MLQHKLILPKPTLRPILTQVLQNSSQTVISMGLNFLFKCLNPLFWLDFFHVVLYTHWVINFL
ncbi:hypothetical protein C8R41DRAFT_851361 [Lentinula lateritia]|uniref:Uncharacterized protein n=1 Tax=Lentinula lateritia TaxID=40482 RepID=A0ABQ8V3J6_9AGAR|nr:hypothetical protein C8R41DRAFT_851361 [Lentinula lateritia]